MKKTLGIAALLALAACSSIPKQSDAEQLAMYRANAGEPVRDFSYFGNLNGWTPLGDAALAVSTKPNEAYLLELSGPCPDLDFAQAIAVSSMMGRVSSGFDKVTPLGAGGNRIPCRITTIRPVNVNNLKAEQQQWREANTVEREAETK